MHHVPVSHRAQFVRFCVVGVANTAVGVGTYELALVAGAAYLVAGAGAFLLGTLTGYALNRSWTFRADSAHVIALPRYLGVQGAALLLNLVLLFALVDGIGVPEAAGQALALPAVSLATFLTHRRWTFADALRRGARLEL